MRFLGLLLVLEMAGCKPRCRDSVARPGYSCPDDYLGARLVVERGGALSPPVVMCRCPSEVTQ